MTLTLHAFLHRHFLILLFIQGFTSKPAEQSGSVMAFLSHMYWSTGESMTKRFLDGKILFENKHVRKNGSLRFESCTTAMKSKTDQELREELLRRLIDQQVLGPCREILELSPERLPYRELPPGTPASLYLMYIAYCRAGNSSPASKSTFYDVWKRWRSCLGFRRASDHSMCAICSRLKTAIHASTDP